MTISSFNNLVEKIQNQSCKIVVIGAGYVGCELAAGFSSIGFKNVSGAL